MIDIKNKSGATILSVPVTENSLRKRQLMGDNNITLVFMLDEAVEIRKGYYIEFAGQKFEVMSDAKPEPDDATGGLKYSVRFDAVDGHMRRFNIFYRHDDIQEVSFALTGDLAAFAQILADCMNFEMGGNSWTVNPPAIEGYKTVSFFGEKLFDAATMIAEAFECEWWIVEGNGIKALHFGKLETGTEETFSRDTILANIQRNEGDKSKYGTRFYCFGGTRNLTPDYYNISQGGTTNHIAEVRLHLPNAQQYIDAVPNLAPEDVVHQVAIFDDIFPKNIDAITAIETAQRQFADGGDSYTAYIMTASATPFLPADIIPGNTLKGVFDSGVLSGQEFELIINQTAFDKKFEIKAQVIGEGETAIVIPNPDFCPIVGDIFVLTGVKLPRSREIEAENELLAAGQAWALKNSVDTDVYDCESNRVYCNQNSKGFEIGQRARLVDATRGLDRSSRVIGYEKRLDDLFDARYTVGDNTAYSRLAAIETSIKEAQYSERIGSEASAVNLIKSWENTKPNDFTAYSSRKADSYFLRASRINQQFGIAGLNQFGQIYDFLIPSHLKTITEKQGSIQGTYNVAGHLYNGLIADIIGNVTIGVTQQVTDQFEVVLYNHDAISHTVTLGLNLWRDAEADLVIGVIRGSAAAETITLQPGQVYRAKAFFTGYGLVLEANIVGLNSQSMIEWANIDNVPLATETTLGIVGLGTAATHAARGNHTHDYAASSHSHTGYAAETHSHTKSNITDFPNSWAWSALTGIPGATTLQAGIVQLGTGASQAAAGNHTHTGFAPTSHNHTKSQISDWTHSHPWSDLTSVPVATSDVAGVVKMGAGTYGDDGIARVAFGTHYHDDLYAALSHSHSGFATSAQGTKADNALPATSYTAADVLAKLLTVDTDTAGINATTVKGIQPQMGGLALLALASLGNGWTTLLGNAKPTTRSGYGIVDAAANVHYHQMSDISDFSAPKGREYFASPINGNVTANVSSYAGVIARMNGDLSLNFSGTIYGEYDVWIYNDSGTYRNLDLNFYNSVIGIKGSAGSTSITIQHGEMYRGKFHYIYAGGDAIMGVADVN